MNHSQFRYMKEACPELYVLASRAELTYTNSPAAAIAELKAAGRWLALDMMKREGQLNEGAEPTDRIAELEAMELLEPAFMSVLRRLELADPRESELFVDVYDAKRLMLVMYDLIGWYYKTYIDDSFRQEPFYIQGSDAAMRGLAAPIQGSDAAMRGLAAVGPDGKEDDKGAVAEIDGAGHAAEWKHKGVQSAHLQTRTDVQGGVYNGEMLGSWRHGQGTYVWADGTKYEGLWVKDMEHGRGHKWYANGDKYYGDWKDGFFHGQGCYEWADGAKYEGSWESGMEHGHGRKTDSDGTRHNGYWSYGELVNLVDQLTSSMIQSRITGV